MTLLERSRRVGQVPMAAMAMAMAMVILVSLVAVGPLGVGIAGAQGTLSVSGLQTDALVNPIGINDLTPALSWNDVDSVNGATQTGYEIQAASSAAALAAGTPLLWDSGQVSSSSQQAAYAGLALASRSTVAWQVRVWDSDGQESAWSAVNTFVIGLTKPTDWTAQWITNPNWTGANAGTGSGNNTPITVGFSSVQAQYVQLNITQLGQAVTSASTFYAQLAEIEVFGPSNPSVNLARGAKVTSSSSIEGWGWSVNYLTDGVTNTLNSSAHGWSSNSYSSAKLSTPITVTINLGSVQSVSSVQLFKRDDVTSTSGGTPSFPVNYSILTSTASATSGFATRATITNQANPPVQSSTYASLPLLAKQFVTTGAPVSANLYISGEGIVVPSLNGQNIGTEVLEPGDSNSADQIGYQEYNVTSMLNASGSNVIGIALGLGSRYIQPTSSAQGNRYDKYSLTPTSGLPRAIAQLEITYADGTTQTIATDGTWTSALGPTTVTAWFGGESYDARLEIPNWNMPGGPSASWSPAVVTTAPATTTVLAGLTAPPLQVVGQNAGVYMGAPGAGSQLYNFGVNQSGWEQFTISAPAGTTLTFTPAQELKSGQAYQDAGTTGSPVYDTFTSNGTTETWHPTFDYHAFQYVQVSGIVTGVTLSNPEQLLIRASNQSAGSITTSSSMINSINSLVGNALSSNMYSILTDPPSREKLGWNEEVWLLFPMIARLYNVDAYGRSLEANLAQAQASSGVVPDTAPYYTSLAFTGGFYDDVNWGSAIIQLPWELYQNYGDTQTMATYYSNMQAYLAYLKTQSSGNLVNYPNGLGDWGESSVTSVMTPINLVENWAYYRDESAMASMATALGKTSDASTYSAAAAATLAAFTASWYNASSKTVANGTQCAIAMALNIGAVPASAVATVTAELVSAINSNGGFAVGEIGLVPLFQVLSAAGDDSLIYQDITADKIGSYGYFVDQGLTSLPEYWNITSGSLDQWMLGEVDLWLNNDLVGIQQTSSSNDFNSIVIKPSVVGGLTSASGTLQTNHGLIAASWSATTSSATMAVTIPTGSVATVYVPIVGTAAPTATAGAVYVGTANGYAQYTVGSGTWNFTT